MTIDQIRKELESLADNQYRDFHSSLIPGANQILGVRIPLLRKMAKQIAKKEWRPFVEMENVNSYEETMLQGMLIGIAQIDFKERMDYIRLFVPRINNWAVCDIFCGELKMTAQKNKSAVWEFIQPYLKSSQEFEIRFGTVMLIHFIDDEYIDRLFIHTESFYHSGYYARMGIAWLLSICFVKFPTKTMEYLKLSKLDHWTYNKALQKITESLRVDKETKALIREMKRKDK